MRLSDLCLDQKVIIQFMLGEQKLEFTTVVLSKDENAVYVKPYMRNETALQLNFEATGGVVCNLFADNMMDNSRVSWKNIKVQTIKKDGEEVYALKASIFNHLSRNDDNRKYDRLVIQKNARVYDADPAKMVDVIVHDISDYGISFYSPTNFAPKSNIVILVYEDAVDDKIFQMKLECQIVRTEKRAGNAFYGCKLLGENKDYLMYGFLKRLKQKHNQRK